MVKKLEDMEGLWGKMNLIHAEVESEEMWEVSVCLLKSYEMT